MGDAEVDFLTGWLGSIFFAAARIMAVFTILPFFSRNLIPGLVRTGVVFGITFFVIPIVRYEMPTEDIDWIFTFSIIIKEVVIGLVIGFAVGSLFWAIEGAGFFVDNQRGASIASTVNPLSGADTTPFGIFFMQLFTVYFMSSGAFLEFLGLLYNSYVVWPVFEFFPTMPADSVPFFLGMLDSIMYFVFVLAGPLIVAMFIAELGLALVSRFAPQLNVFILAMPVKSGVALLVLTLYMPFLIGYLDDALDRIPELFDLIIHTMPEFNGEPQG